MPDKFFLIQDDELLNCYNYKTTYWDVGKRRKSLFNLVVNICSSTKKVSFAKYHKRCVEIADTVSGTADQTKYPAAKTFATNLSKVKKFKDEKLDKEPNYRFNDHISAREKTLNRKIDERFYNAMAIYAVRLWRDGEPFSKEDNTLLREFLNAVKFSNSDPEDVLFSSICQLVTGRYHNSEATPEEIATKRFFGAEFDKEPKKLHFDTYRFSSIAGHVEKSFTVILSPDHSESPVTRFVNFFYSDGLSHTDLEHSVSENGKKPMSFNRRVDGVALGFSAGTYLIGPSEDAAFLKVIVLKGELSGNNTICGATLSTDHEGKQIMGKLIMKPSKFSSTDELKNSGDYLNIGTNPLDDFKKTEELSPLDIKAMRNSAEMKLEEPLYRWNGKKYVKIGQKFMVAQVEDTLNKGNSGKSAYSLQKPRRKEEFNPADTEQYTFNGAIEI